MHRGFGGDFPFRVFQTQIEVDRIHIHQHWFRFEVGHYFGRRSKRKSGHEDLIAFFQADGVQRKVKRGCAGIHRDRVAHAKITGECVFEGLCFRPRRDPPAFECFNDSADLLLANARNVKWHRI